MAVTMTISTKRKASNPNFQSKKVRRLGFRRARDTVVEKLSTEQALVSHLPVDLTMEIFARLPAKSLAKCRCVCKQWHSLLMDSEIATKQAILAQENPIDDKVVCFLFDSSLYKVKPYWVEDNSNIFDSNLEAAENKIALPTKNARLSHEILGSCNGLIFLNHGIKRKRFFLFNPLTGESRHLFNLPCGDKVKTQFGFGYDSSTQDYKIIRFQTDPYILQVFSLKDNCWRSINSTIEQFPYLLEHPVAVQVCGFLHWQVIGPNPDIVLTFDLGQEKFGELINIPKDPEEDTRIVGVGILQGCLCVTRRIGFNKSFGIWAMKKYGVAESWTKLITLKESPAFLDAYQTRYFQLFPIRYINNGRKLILQNFNNSIIYDIEKGSYKISHNRIPIIPREEHESWLMDSGSSTLKMTSYVESLVSPNSLCRV
ncbi:hypothetical protein COLO4_28698 [Corchorus olitorius]|uniref:F-box domain-containing protein n=1 Tax=Corchorus olitorius TaxID=93759 RepID=A0A1R3HIT2_9ROSI|nr:hypothetical protein COLO4_28698 [Corchorus olitorius]